MPVFTSRNDDQWGAWIGGSELNAYSDAVEPDSNGNPTQHRASNAIWIYYSDYSVLIRNARILWAQTAIRCDRNPEQTSLLTVEDCIFQNIPGVNGESAITGELMNLASSGLRKCSVYDPDDYMTQDCTGIENEFDGDSSWQLSTGSTPATAGWPGYTTQPEIEGFASLTSVNVGQEISFYVSVKNPGTDLEYKIHIYRMGWYNGIGGRKMGWSDGEWITEKVRSSQTQPLKSPDSNGTVDCLATPNPWTDPYKITVPHQWISGVYLAKLTTSSSAKASYIIFTVREDSRSSDLYFQNSVTTWQAYNPWGGRSLYNYLLNTTAATTVSFNRPYAGPIDRNTLLAYGTGAGEFLVQINYDPRPAWEYNALRWIEKTGFDVTYCTDIDTHSGSLLNKSVKAFLSVGHDEYWSEGMRNNVEAARDRTSNPVNLVFMGANICYWQIHFSTDLRSYSCVKTPFPGPDRWRDPNGINDPESSLIGIEYMYNTILPGAAVKIPANSTHWVFTHSAAYNASQTTSLPGLLGYEVDGVWASTPPGGCADELYPTSRAGITILAISDFLACNPHISTGNSYMSIYTNTSGANVFATGTLQWTWGLDDFGYPSRLDLPSNPSFANAAARQITYNVLRKLTGKGLAVHP